MELVEKNKIVIIIMAVIIVMLLCGLVIRLKNSDFQRKFTGEYKELVFCEDNYELNEKNKKCIKIDSDADAKTLDYEYINPYESWGVGWKLVSTQYSSPKKLFVSILPLKEDFEHRYECYTFSKIDTGDSEKNVIDVMLYLK